MSSDNDQDIIPVGFPDIKRHWDISIGWRKNERFVLFGIELFGYDFGWDSSLLNIIHLQVAWFQLDIGYWFDRKDKPE